MIWMYIALGWVAFLILVYAFMWCDDAFYRCKVADKFNVLKKLLTEE